MRDENLRCLGANASAAIGIRVLDRFEGPVLALNNNKIRCTPEPVLCGDSRVAPCAVIQTFMILTYYYSYAHKSFKLSHRTLNPEIPARTDLRYTEGILENSMNNYAIIDDLLKSLPDTPVPVRSVLVGAHWTSVCITHCGLATTIIGGKPHDHTTVVRDAGNLHWKSAQELAAYARSEISWRQASVSPQSTRSWG